MGGNASAGNLSSGTTRNGPCRGWTLPGFGAQLRDHVLAASECACLNRTPDASMMSAKEAEWRRGSMEHDGFEKLRAYLGGLVGGSCTLPFERIRELTGRVLPEAATSSAWWTDPDGWHAWPASSVCGTAGWQFHSVHASARLVRLERIGDNAAGG